MAEIDVEAIRARYAEARRWGPRYRHEWTAASRSCADIPALLDALAAAEARVSEMEGIIEADRTAHAEALEAERARRQLAEQRADEAALRSIEARNPGIDMDEVRLLWQQRGSEQP